jgi:glutamate dehydrogenase (NADP+)
MFGQYKRLRNEFTGVLTGKGRNWGGSLIRPEATGFGGVYFVDEMLKANNESYKGKRVALSGFGNVAWGAAIKATELGAKVVTISGPDGYVYDPDGVGTEEKWNAMLEMRSSGRNMVKDYADKFGVEFFPGKKPWDVAVDIAFPCAIQNELDLDDAKKLVANGCQYIAELSNMGCTADAAKYATDACLFAPGKAVNAGGVAVSGLEMSQNSMRYNWSSEDVDNKLKDIMKSIHDACLTASEEYGMKGNYVVGANIAGFKKVADAMIDQGLV